jgi:hypothetical protein
MVLSGFGMVWTEAQVRAVLGQPRLGITLTAAHARLVQAGAHVALHADWGLDDLRDALRQGQYPVVGVERHALGYPPTSHAIVVIRLTSHAVSILDPLDGPQAHEYGRETFGLAWQLAGHEALVLQAPPPSPDSAYG